MRIDGDVSRDIEFAQTNVQPATGEAETNVSMLGSEDCLAMSIVGWCFIMHRRVH